MKALNQKVKKMNALVEAYRLARENSRTACKAIVITDELITLPDGTAKTIELINGGEAWLEARKAEQIAKANARSYVKRTAEACGFKLRKSLSTDTAIEDVASLVTRKFERALRAMQDVPLYDDYLEPTLI